MKIKEKLHEMFEEFKIDFDESKNMFYFFNKHKVLLGGIFALLGFVFGVLGFLYEGKHLFESITNTFALFALNTPDSYDKTNIFLLLSTVFISITIFSAALFAFFQEFVNRIIAKRIIAKEHNVVFGLGQINRAFLNSDEKDCQTVIIESDPNNKYIEEYRQKGFGIVVGDALTSKQLELLNYETMVHAIISLGNDRLNIELAIELIKKIKEAKPQTPTRLVVHISNHELREIFHQEFVLTKYKYIDLTKYKFCTKCQNFSLIKLYKYKYIQIDIKTFSFYEECSKDLFENTNLIPTSYIDTNNEFKSIVLGNGTLAISVIKDLLLLSNFPNKNIHTITLISKDAKTFYENIKLETFYSEDKFPTVKFEIIESDWKTPDFYKSEIFYDKDLSNIYVCYDDEDINTNLTMELKNRIYTRLKDSQTKIHFGIFNEYQLSHLINEDKDKFNRFYTFGNLEDIFSKQKLLDEENYMIAKLIHNGYGDIYNDSNLVNIEDLNKKWFNNTKFSDKLSNIAQAKHINTKLQILGLTKEKNIENVNTSTLLKQNKDLFNQIIEQLLKESNISIDEIIEASKELPKYWSQKEYEVKYMPKEFNTLFEKLIEMEHERWNSYHYLNGWEYSHKKDKDLKYHDCLKPLDEFKEKNLQITVLYDIYSILYIPNYLANAEYLLKKI